MCEIPQEWVVISEKQGKKREIIISAKMAWKMAKKKQHDRMKALRKKGKSVSHVSPIGAHRHVVRKQTVTESFVEKGVFKECQTCRTRKKVKNSASKEEAGTIGSYVATKRFSGSYITCTYKSKRI